MQITSVRPKILVFDKLGKIVEGLQSHYSQEYN